MNPDLTPKGIGIPDGRYPGVWCGYEITFDVLGHKVTAKTEHGCRGVYPVFVVVKDGRGIIEEVKT